jgi:hypothetical protein
MDITRVSLHSVQMELLQYPMAQVLPRRHWDTEEEPPLNLQAGPLENRITGIVAALLQQELEVASREALEAEVVEVKSSVPMGLVAQVEEVTEEVVGVADQEMVQD